MELTQVATEKEGARDRDTHHFMWIDGDRVGQVRASEFVCVRGREDGWATPGSVDMQPEGMRDADGCDRLNGVERSKDGSSGGRVDEEGSKPFGLGLFNQSTQLRWYHAAGRVGRYGPDCRTAESEHLCRFLDTIVAMSAGKEDEFPALDRVSILLGIWKESIAGDYDRGCIRCRTALD